MRIIVFCIGIAIAFSGCSIFRQQSKYEFADGTYSSNVLDTKPNKVYVENKGETITVYPLAKTANGYIVDTSVKMPVTLLENSHNLAGQKTSFRQNSFDVDFLTIPFKYRFPAAGFPRQFTSSLNGAVFLGYRRDVYAVRYPVNLLGRASRKITHFGFSFGGFTGLGSTAMNPWVTNNQIAIEYDGVVWTKGISGIIGLNNFTTGLALGWDHLLDGNRKSWIYQNRPWVGFVFGLNLN